MQPSPQRKRARPFLRKLRIAFRRFRIAVLVLLFLLVCAGGWLNKYGLPGFIKRPLLENLRSRGVDLEFSKLRLRGYRGIVADNVRLLGGNSAVLPVCTARSADVRLDYAALLRLKLEVRGVTLRDGSLIWDLAKTNEPPQILAITNLTADVRLLPGNEWSLDNIEMDFAGVHFQASAHIANANKLREWAVFQGRTKQPPEAGLARLRRFRDAFDQIAFTGHPRFQLHLDGDATHPESFSGRLTLEKITASSPWGDVTDGEFALRLCPANSNAAHSAELTLTAANAKSRWVNSGALNLNLAAQRGAEDANALQLKLDAVVADISGGGVAVAQASLQAGWNQSLTHLMSIAGESRIELINATSQWATASSVAACGTFRPRQDPMASDPAHGVWAHLLPWVLEFNCAITNASSKQVYAESLGLAASWNAPELVITNFNAHMPDGSLEANAAVDILTRRLDFSGRTAFDLRQLGPILTEKSRTWLERFTWKETPALQLGGSLTLPEWTNRHPDWRGEIQPTVVLAGSAALTNGSYRGIGVQTASTQLHYSNRVWHLPDLIINRTEGELRVNLRSEEISHDYLIKLQGSFDPRDIAPQLDEKGKRALGYFEFTNAPWLDLQITGRWFEPERISASGSVGWTNFSYRGQHMVSVAGSLDYTNKMLRVFNPRADRVVGHATAESLSFDFAAKRGYLVNGFSDTDPMAIARCIGPITAKAVEPYQFLQPPVIHAHGTIPLTGNQDADLHFQLDGGPFHWLKFKTPHIAGDVHWANQSVTLTNIVTSFYGGEARGNAWFDVREKGSTPFAFDLTATNADLHALMSDLKSPTNKLEGFFTGRLVITSANSHNFNSWNGYGYASLRDGLIWDSPVFGTISSFMNAFIPGIGNSRASEAGGNFTISNSVIITSDLKIRASAMRLKYDGTVDFATRVEARVEAELLRDTWLVGPLLRNVLWPVSKMFEYKVTGTLASPDAQPAFFLPRMFLAPLHPVRTFKDMFDSKSNGATEEPLWPVRPDEGN